MVRTNAARAAAAVLVAIGVWSVVRMPAAKAWAMVPDRARAPTVRQTTSAEVAQAPVVKTAEGPLTVTDVLQECTVAEPVATATVRRVPTGPAAATPLSSASKRANPAACTRYGLRCP